MNDILSTDTLAALSDEYLQGSDEQGVRNAEHLAHYVRRVRFYPSDNQLIYKRRAWTPIDNSEPYGSFDEMALAMWHFDNGSLAGDLYVSDCFHDHPVFDRRDNLRFRVWHDTGHYEAMLGFDRDSELELFQLQARQIGLNSDIDVTTARHTVDALFSESVYQLAAAVTLGTFPDQQFVRSPGPVGRAVLDAWGL